MSLRSSTTNRWGAAFAIDGGAAGAALVRGDAMRINDDVAALVVVAVGLDVPLN